MGASGSIVAGPSCTSAQRSLPGAPLAPPAHARSVRHRGRGNSIASDSDVANAPFDVLPEPALRVIFLALPVDARAQAACVCRAWRAFLADVSLWLQLDLTPSGGVAAERVTENLVRSAVARAAGQLRVFSLPCELELDAAQLLVDVIVSDGAELQQVNTCAWLTVGQLRAVFAAAPRLQELSANNEKLSVADLVAVFAAAPRLQVLNAGVEGECMELLPVLRNDAPYGPMRVSDLLVDFGGVVMNGADVQAWAAAVAAHVSLKRLVIRNAPSARELNALMDALMAAERRISWLSIEYCRLDDAEFVPALARLLERGSLTKLEIYAAGFPHAQEESVPVLCAALRACPTLMHLKLCLNPPNGASRQTVMELIEAAASLPALAELNLDGSSMQDTPLSVHWPKCPFWASWATRGHPVRALTALLRANLPCLRTLVVDDCRLGDGGMALLLDGLAANTHLRKLSCLGANYMSTAFERKRLEPALTALAARAQLDA